MTEQTEWNMADKYYELVIAVKERYLTSLAEDDPINMIKWVTALYDEVFMVLEEEQAGKLEKEIRGVKNMAFSSVRQSEGIYNDQEDKGHLLYEVMGRTQAVYRELLKVMYDRKMVIPWQPKRDLGRVGVELD